MFVPLLIRGNTAAAKSRGLSQAQRRYVTAATLACISGIHETAVASPIRAMGF